MDYCLGVEIGNDTTSWARTERTHDTITVTATGEFASVVGLDSSGALAAAGADIELAHLTTDFVDSLGQSEPVIVGQTPYGVEALIACLISAAVATNRTAIGAPPDAVGLVHPDGMDEFRLSLLSEAARIAGLPAEHTIVMSRSDARAHTPDGPAGAGAATAAWAGIPVTPIAGAAGTATAAAAGAATAAGLTAAAVHLSADSTASAAGATAGPAGTSIAGTPTGPAGTSIGTTTGPAGTPIGSAGTTTGPAGTPIGATGATGTPITPAGPTGAPITPTAGPAGTPLDIATTATRVRPRWFPAAVAAGAVAVVAVVAVVVVASGSDDPPPEAAPATTIIENRSAGDPGTPGATTPAATTPAATTPDTTPDTVAAVEFVSGSDECLVGDWAISAEQMNRFYAEVLAGVDSPFRMVASGSISLSFGADGTFIWAPALTLAMDVEEIAMTGASSGEVTGRWTTTGDTLTFVDTANNITTTFSVEGVAVDSGAFGTQLTTSPPADVPYSCAGATPVIDFPAGSGANVPMTLAPA